VRVDRIPADLVRRDDEYLRGALERFGQGLRLAEIAAPHPDPALGQVGGAAGVANTDTHLLGREPLEQRCDDEGAKLAGRAGDDDHCPPPVISGISSMLTVISADSNTVLSLLHAGHKDVRRSA
jgi:hypothetical protein